MPETPIPGSPAASPLGAGFTGSCASGGSPAELLLPHCNHGYARSFCPHANAVEADAARFRICSHAGGVIEIAWSTERDHHPVAVGILRLTEAATNPAPLEQQARACAKVYLQRTGAAW